MGFLDGKRILVTGVLSNRSIAYGIARACRREGAALAFTYQNDRFKDRVTEMAAELGSELVFPCDVAADDDDFGVDDGDRLPVFLIVSGVERGDEEADAFVHLRRGEADAVILGHRLDHVVDEPLNRCAQQPGPIERAGSTAEHRVPHARHLENGH